MHLKDPIPPKSTPQQVLGIYKDKIKEVVVDGKGDIVKGKTPEEIGKSKNMYPMYIYEENNQPQAYAFPIEGKGLWSTLYGYFAVEPDAITVRGITFYKDGETPGLGAEIEKDWFQNNFVGKKIWDVSQKKLRPTTVIKGKVADKYKGKEAQYYVDGISGATLTSRGVTNLLAKWLTIYEPFLAKVRSGKT